MIWITVKRWKKENKYLILSRYSNHISANKVIILIFLLLVQFNNIIYTNIYIYILDELTIKRKKFLIILLMLCDSIYYILINNDNYSFSLI